MKKFLSILLSVVIVLSMVCIAAPAVSAASALKTSDKCIAMIKKFEGFVAKPYEDNGNWSVGYGTGVSGDALEKYMQNGITEAEAEVLLRRYLTSFEGSVNSFIDKHGLKLSQNQFDALVCFTYNLGPSWMNNTSYALTSAIINGATGNDFIFAIAQWCKASGTVYKSLIERRLCEANLYLNGVYSTSVPVHYRYVIFNTGDEYTLPSISVQGYESTKSVDVKATVSRAGYEFLGWYTSADGGSVVTTLNSATTANTLHAHWQKEGGNYDAEGNLVGVSASYSGYAPIGVSRDVYDVPGGKVTDTVDGEEKLTVVAEHLDSEGVKWGKLSTGGWINVSKGLEANAVYEKPESILEKPVVVTVTTSNVNNRMGPGTNYAKNGTYSKGQQLTLTAVQEGGRYTWGKSEIGWICLDYTNYDSILLENSDEVTKVTAIGTIINADTLNIRSAPGVDNPKVGSYRRNEVVYITLRQKVGNTTWGRTDKGWISLYYVKLTEVEEGAVPDIDVSGGTGGSTGGTGSGSTGGSAGSTTVIATGKIVNCNTLRIRSAAGTNNAHIGNYKSGDYVNIYEKMTLRNDVWGRTEKGWICLRYVKLDAPVSGDGITGRVVNCDALTVRAAAGTQNAKVGKLERDAKVEILEYTTVGNAKWGRTVYGWIHLHYVKLDAPLSDLDKAPESGSGTQGGTGSDSTGGSTGGGTQGGETTEKGISGTIVNCDAVNVRTGAGTNHTKVGKMYRGAKVVILEYTKVGNATWGRTAQGWIHLYYVKLDAPLTDLDKAETPETGEGTGGTGTEGGNTDTEGGNTGTEGGNTGTGGVEGGEQKENVTFTATVTANPTLNIRSGAGTSTAVVGSYKYNDKVTILDTLLVGKTIWGRTDKGWISLYYVQPDGTTNYDDVTVKIISQASVPVYAEPDTKSSILYTYYRNNVVVIYYEGIHAETNVRWGLTENGWILMSATE